MVELLDRSIHYSGIAEITRLILCPLNWVSDPRTNEGENGSTWTNSHLFIAGQ